MNAASQHLSSAVVGPAAGGRAAATRVGTERTFDDWRVRAADPTWRDEWWPTLRSALSTPDGSSHTSRHARTRVVELRDPETGETRRLYLKIYDQAKRLPWWKAFLRRSKADRFLRACRALQERGIGAPQVLAIGEHRRLGRLREALLLTASVPGIPLDALPSPVPAWAAGAERRLFLCRLGEEVARLHRNGFVHGDLLPGNILYDAASLRFVFLDHDRTAWHWTPRRGHLQRRNLIQLNRLELTGVSNADRYRVFRAYGEALGWERERIRREARRLARWTRERRLEIERINAGKGRSAAAGGRAA